MRNLAFNYDPNCDYSSNNNVTIGSMTDVCRYCGALKWKLEPPSMCCNLGKVKISTIAEPPEPLSSLFKGMSRDSKHFLKYIRYYNSCFQMTSFGAEIIRYPGYNSSFKIQGKIHHLIGALLPVINEQPKFLQIYFMGNTGLQINRRCKLFQQVQRNLVHTLQIFLEEHNILIRLFKYSLESAPDESYEIVIKAKVPPGAHPRTYNALIVDEIAVLLDGDVAQDRDIVLQQRDNRLLRISEFH